MLVKVRSLICFGEILKSCLPRPSSSRNANESVPRMNVPLEVRPEEWRCFTESFIGTDQMRGSTRPLSHQAERWLTKSASRNTGKFLAAALSLKADQRIWR